MIFSIPQLYRQKRVLKCFVRLCRAYSRRRSFPTILALALIVFGTLGGYVSLHAATSTRRAPLVFQGRISDANYVPVADGSRNMVFRIWDASTGGTCLWITGTGTTNCSATANSDSVAVAATITRGVLSVPLGDTSVTNMPVLNQDFDNQSSQVYYLSISIETNTNDTYEDLSPRIRMSAVPYAYNADELDGVPSTQFLGGASFNPVPSSFTTLNGGINTTVTTIPVASTSGYPVSGTLLIDSEIVTYTGLGASVATCGAGITACFTGATRARHSTTAASHLTGATVSNYVLIVASGATAAPLLSITGGGAITFSGAAHTGLTASTEATDINFNLNRTVTFATGALATQRAMRIQAPTYDFAGASTLTNASTISIDDLPKAGSSATITNRFGLLIAPTTNSSSNYYGIYNNMANLAVTTNFESFNMYATTPSVSNGAATNTRTYGLFVDGYQDGSTRLTHSEGAGTDTWYGVRIYPPNQLQTTGTVTSVGLSIERPATETSGSFYALTTNTDAGNIGFGTLTPASYLTITQPAISGGRAAFTLTPGAHTAVTSGITDFTIATHTNTLTGSVTTQNFSSFDQSTITATSGTPNTTFASTVHIGGPPIASGTATITTAAALRITGFTLVSATATDAYSLYIDAPSGAGTNKYAAYLNGRVGIGITTPLTTLDLTGNFRLTGRATGTLTGTIDPAASTTVTGVGTLFTKELVIGDRITVTGETRTVTTIASDTSLTVDTAFSDNANDTSPDVLYALATFRDSSNTLKVTINDLGYVSIGGAISYTPSSTQSITAVSNTISANAAMIVLDPSADLTLTSAPTIANGSTGQIIYITAGNSETNTVTLQDQDTLASSNLQLGAATRAISGKDVLVLMFDGTDWIEISYANN
ncbi:hypothetical protein HY732_04275 [Candidatus Uhrbacteria bacterium]|nr:hypothetical protein [Candidatus Uhrbacteria bacterium]